MPHSQPASQSASQHAGLLSHRIMNDIFTRGRHEESITRTERILIREPLEEEEGMQSKRRSGKQRQINGNRGRERRSDKVFFEDGMG